MCHFTIFSKYFIIFFSYHIFNLSNLKSKKSGQSRQANQSDKEKDEEDGSHKDRDSNAGPEDGSHGDTPVAVVVAEEVSIAHFHIEPGHYSKSPRSCPTIQFIHY